MKRGGEIVNQKEKKREEKRIQSREESRGR
jgi:hypothetical protein